MMVKGVTGTEEVQTTTLLPCTVEQQLSAVGQTDCWEREGGVSSILSGVSS